jgi:hypothetical protein
LFFRIEKNYPGIYRFIHLTLRSFSRNNTVRTRT